MRPILFFLIAAIGAGAQQVSPPTLRVHGQATVTTLPDQVQLDIAVVTQAATAKAARDENSTKSDALIQQLHTLALPPANISSINLSVNPSYRYSGNVPTVAGYTASNTVRILLNDLSKLQSAIDLAINAGATSINRLAFTLIDQNRVRADALAQAAKQAEAEAGALAESLKLKLGPLISVEEGQPVIVSPPREVSFEKLQSTGVTPISPGNIDVHADVNLTYEIVEGN